MLSGSHIAYDCLVEELRFYCNVVSRCHDVRFVLDIGIGLILAEIGWLMAYGGTIVR